jgi:hypothetical protein
MSYLREEGEKGAAASRLAFKHRRKKSETDRTLVANEAGGKETFEVRHNGISQVSAENIVQYVQPRTLRRGDFSRSVFRRETDDQ